MQKRASARCPRVGNGARTRDTQSHNLVLYQLNYTHHLLSLYCYLFYLFCQAGAGMYLQVGGERTEKGGSRTGFGRCRFGVTDGSPGIPHASGKRSGGGVPVWIPRGGGLYVGGWWGSGRGGSVRAEPPAGSRKSRRFFPGACSFKVAFQNLDPAIRRNLFRLGEENRQIPVIAFPWGYMDRC